MAQGRAACHIESWGRLKRCIPEEPPDAGGRGRTLACAGAWRAEAWGLKSGFSSPVELHHDQHLAAVHGVAGADPDFGNGAR